MDKYICIHGHFYQPPRENPWLEAIELQDSAYPYHDWNERVSAECYAPNAMCRILDGDGKIVRIVNNYARISFNVGPTLLSWMEEKEPETYRQILEADRDSRERFSGHGSAMAQVYNHLIMPLANERDRHTQVLWGIADFEARFGRKPEGMWLAEAAVDVMSLEILAEHGIVFTVLAPHQAKRLRRVGAKEWSDAAPGGIDPTRGYWARLPSGRSLAVFFYDGPISRAIAFERLLDKGESRVNRLMGGFSDGRDWPQLVHVATDGETYGHHHRYGDMALAYALSQIESAGKARLTNYGEYLERCPPTHEVEIVENSSWSCAHGIERWRSDCGCNTGARPGWNQAWRAPLRDALDWLRDTAAPLYEQAAAEFFTDPWSARNEYIFVLLDRSPDRVEEFLARVRKRELTNAERTAALKLLELQRQALLMYTSCGWFFADISGIETVQVMEYAGARDPARGRFVQAAVRRPVPPAIGSGEKQPAGIRRRTRDLQPDGETVRDGPGEGRRALRHQRAFRQRHRRCEDLLLHHRLRGLPELRGRQGAPRGGPPARRFGSDARGRIVSIRHPALGRPQSERRRPSALATRPLMTR